MQFAKLFIASHSLLVGDDDLRVHEFRELVVLLGHDEAGVSFRGSVLIQLQVVEATPVSSFVVGLDLEQLDAYLRVVENLVGSSDAVVVVELA